MSLLEMLGVEKSFNSVQVLYGVDFKLRKGTVHALMGENGAGKSTLMKGIAGLHKFEQGKILVNGKEVNISTPKQSQLLGIAMIHQELSPEPEMTVAENIFLGREPTKGIFVDFNKMYKDTQQLLTSLGVDLNPKQKVGKLKVADQQLIEIAKAMSLNAEIIIMDEPTSAITDREVDKLFDIICELKKAGKGIIYISHKMDEIFQIADDITVLRDGHYVNTWQAKDIDNEVLIKSMVGRELKDVYPKIDTNIMDVMLEIKGFSKEGQYKDISFNVKRGEIYGIAGLIGAGRTELMHGIFGLDKSDSGEIYVNGEKVIINSPKDAIKYKLAYVTEDRKDEGLSLEMEIGKNISLSSLKELTDRIFINKKKEKKIIDEQSENLKIKMHSTRQLVKFLSGGNQQKVVLGKWLVKAPKILILDEPTRGIDIGAKSEIYKLMSEFVSKGNSIIMISSEMPEVMGMSDRILVLSNGEVGGELERKDFTQEKIMSLAMSKM